MKSSENAVIAVDVGGTNIRLAAVTAEGGILNARKGLTPREGSPDEVVGLIADMAAECLRSGEIGTCKAIGVGVPANVTPDGPVRRLPNLPLFEGFDLWQALRHRLKVPAALENDATAACIGEAWLGASRGISNSILVTLGTGVGGGVMVNGQALRGLDGGAGKIGHICVEPDGHQCGCGSHGCIEQYASATALVRMASEAGRDVKDSAELYKEYKQGERVAREVFERMGRYLGITLAGLINTLNPEMIVIGGGVAAGFDAFIGPLEDEIRLRAFAESAERARVVRSRLGDNAGILGAARAAFALADPDLACTESVT